jgi:thiol-disulfide isomerase/thioredoxin
MKKTLLFIGITLISVLTFGQSQRLVVAEEFTSATCGPCASQNPAFDALLQQNAGIITSIKYHMSWPMPGNDPMYLQNPEDNNARRSYYGVNSVPHVFLDGNYFSGMPVQVTQNTINSAAAIPSPFEMQVQHRLSPNHDSIYVTTLIKATDNVSGDLVAHVVVIEKHIHFNSPPGTNGERDFYNVMKKMLPDKNGTSIHSTFTSGDYVILQNSWLLANVYDTSQLAVVSFVQNDFNKNIHQGALSSTDPITPPYANDAEILNVGNVTSKNCSGKIHPYVTIRNNGSNTLTSLHIEYSVNEGETFTYDWTGSLDFLETDVIDLGEIQFTVADTNSLVINGLNPNGIGDDYTPNNELYYTFYRAPVLSGTVNMFMILDDHPEETTWQLKNSSGEIIQEGGPYSNPGAMVIEPLNITQNDCYEVIVRDAGGNGMCCDFGNGYYAVIYGNNQTAFEGSTFDSLQRNELSYDVVGMNEFKAYSNVNIGPNPSTGTFNVNFILQKDVNVSLAVYDFLGKELVTVDKGFQNRGEKRWKVDVSALGRGIYLFEMKLGDETFVKKIAVE